jgi:hypothetical protein
MIPGFNTNLSHGQQAYHVQTEDVGGDNPHVLTLAYRGGAVVAQIKTPYSELLGTHPSLEALRALMTSQHRQMIADIQAGKFEGERR